MILKKVIDPDGTVHWYGTNQGAVDHLSGRGGTMTAVEVKGAISMAALLMQERRDAIEHYIADTDHPK